MAKDSEIESTEVSKLLKHHVSIEKIAGTNKLKCRLTGHEMPCTLQAIKTYVAGKKFRKVNEECSFDYSEYKDLFLPAKKKNKSGMLQCQLTLRHVSQQWHHIDRHIKGKRFQREHKRYLECKETGEVFKPRGGQKQKNNDGKGDDEAYYAMEGQKEDDEEDEQPNTDDMTDLYPCEESSDADSDYTFDEEVLSEDPVQKLTPQEIPQTGKDKSKKTTPKEKTKKKKRKIQDSEPQAKQAKYEKANGDGSQTNGKKTKQKAPKTWKAKT